MIQLIIGKVEFIIQRLYLIFIFNCHKTYVYHMLFFIALTWVHIITPCSFHCPLIMMIFLFILKKWINYFGVTHFIAFIASWKFLVPIFLVVWEYFVTMIIAYKTLKMLCDWSNVLFNTFIIFVSCTRSYDEYVKGVFKSVRK
jgi:hypothetical protein